MGWLIAVLFGLVLLGGIVVLIRGRGRGRQPADDTLITELLGPPDVPAMPAPQAQKGLQPPPAPQAREEVEPCPDPQAREGAESSPAPSAPQAGESDWLETQLAWITAWSQRMHQQIASADRPDPDRKE